MVEGVEGEIPPEFTVDHVEDVLVELLGDPRRVVVGRNHEAHLFDEVDSNQEPVVAV